MKKKKRIRIFGIPLRAEPGDPVGAPKWWPGEFLYRFLVICAVLAFYLWFGVLPAWYAEQSAAREALATTAAPWAR